MDRGTGQGSQLHGEDLGVLQGQPQTADAEEGIGLAVLGEPPDRFVAARIDGTDGHRPIAGPPQDGFVDVVLRLLIRQPGRIVEQEFRSHQTDAVGVAASGCDRSATP